MQNGSAKYDRQIRLWAHSGQQNLEKSHICLIGAGVVGAETLKNLVLPGIGSFTIIDSRPVEESDLSGQFFLQRDDIGKTHGRAVSENLCALNPDVRGRWAAGELAELLKLPAWWDKFTAVIVTSSMAPSDLETLSQILWTRNIPLVHILVSGFYGALRLVARETTIVDTHDPSKMFDLRIDRPWPELRAHADSFDLEALDDTDHAHVPYIVIFIKALDQWKLLHGELEPKNYAEKTQFKALVGGMARDLAVETNFIEATQSIHRALQKTCIPGSLEALLAHDRCDLTEPTEFWLYVKALRHFVAGNGGQLPLPGSIPDMATTTNEYVALQNIYRVKAQQDRQCFTEHLVREFKRAGLPTTQISEDTVRVFCQNAAFLHVSTGCQRMVTLSLVSQLQRDTPDSSLASLWVYFAMLALQESHVTEEAFLEALRRLAQRDPPPHALNLAKELYNTQTRRYHNVCSFLGGVAGQEVLKIATAQYIPLNNLLVFDGVGSVTSKWTITE